MRWHPHQTKGFEWSSPSPDLNQTAVGPQTGPEMCQNYNSSAKKIRPIFSPPKEI